MFLSPETAERWGISFPTVKSYLARLHVNELLDVAEPRYVFLNTPVSMGRSFSGKNDLPSVPCIRSIAE